MFVFLMRDWRSYESALFKLSVLHVAAADSKLSERRKLPIGASQAQFASKCFKTTTALGSNEYLRSSYTRRTKF